jgi:hypothetical protein
MTLTRAFARHYVEMVIVMFVGMGALAVPARLATSAVWPEVDVNDPTLMLARMGAIMALPMVPWMRWRGHGWQSTLEMAAAMIVPAIGSIALLESGLVESTGALMSIEHVAMFIAMFAAMIARPDEYSHGHAALRPARSRRRRQRRGARPFRSGPAAVSRTPR